MKKEYLKRTIIAVIGNIFIGASIGFLNTSLLGVDPYSAFAVALGAKVGTTFAVTLFTLNIICFVLEFICGRKYIGLGTICNLFMVGNIATITGEVITALVPRMDGMAVRIILMTAGVLILSFGISLYQHADMGVAPYDALSLMLEERLPIPYFWCRIITDGMCVVGAFFLGGPLGIGTLICAFGLGPFIQFFDHVIFGKRQEKSNKRTGM